MPRPGRHGRLPQSRRRCGPPWPSATPAGTADQEGGKPLPDPDLRGYENVPLGEDIDEYLAREVLPHLPDAWIAEIKDPATGEKTRAKIGYEIPFTRYFYTYTPPRPLAEIDAELRSLAAEIQAAHRRGDQLIYDLAPWLAGSRWPTIPIRYVAQLGTGHTPSRQHPEYWENCTIPWVTLADVWQLRDGTTDVIHETAEKISTLGLANSAAVKHSAGTVILSRTASVGFSAILGSDMATSQDFATWTCGPRLYPRYLLHALRAMAPDLRRLSSGSTHKTVYMPDIEELRIPLPPMPEQLRIAAYLDAQRRFWTRAHSLPLQVAEKAESP